MTDCPHIEIHAADAILTVTNPELVALIVTLATNQDAFPTAGLQAIHAHFGDRLLKLEYQASRPKVSF